MKFVETVYKEEILRSAIKLIKKSQAEIIVTMDLTEEIKTPLPQDYHQLISSKAKRGIKIKRLGFGRAKDFEDLSKQYPKIKNLYFIFAGARKNYQRMLVIDRKEAIFKVENQVIFSKFEPLVLSLVKFFEIIYNQRKEV